ncbi:hypothetical protein L198_05196 [Cryptococcus wingfieldii CBS 7118]|uniref:Uncharacterized protein n=1 Tax=Cryptococcus wingfieldii CBS 7118 TaxID=1295528 RepID=A0A1E3J0G1_9TREE|nr:hypothetical protein L198_05196 [Cryptococcus wingfieldii CBS 7118]ODN94339.1 hypothetical protein L198_05196 [Cryptococcus wingfieldii CBS 7118]
MSSPPPSNTFSQEDVQSHVDQTVHQLKDTWGFTSRAHRLAFLAQDTSLSKLPEDTPDEEYEEAERSELIKRAFFKGTEKRIGDRIRYTAEEPVTQDSLGNSRTPMQIETSSVFAEGQENPQKWLVDFTASVIEQGQQNVVSNALLGLNDPLSPAHVMNAIVGDKLNNILLQDYGSALVEFEDSCKDMSIEDLEKQLDRMSGFPTPKQDRSTWQKLAVWSENAELVGHLSGEVIGEYSVTGESLNSTSLEVAKEGLRKQLEAKESLFQGIYGEAAPEDLNDTDSLPEGAHAMNEYLLDAPSMKAYMEFQPLSQTIEGLSSIFMSNDRSHHPVAQDILSALRNNTRKYPYKSSGILSKIDDARLSLFKGVDQLTAAISNNPDMQFFRQNGMAPDERTVDWSQLTIRLVEEDSVDAPSKLEELRPRRMEDLTSGLDGEDEKGTADDEKSELPSAHEMSYLTY